MVAAIALTAGLVLVFGGAEPNRPSRTVDVITAAQIAESPNTSSTTSTVRLVATGSTSDSQAGHKDVPEEVMEIMGAGMEVSATTTTTTPTPSTTTPRQATTTTRPQSPPSTSNPTTTTTTPATTTTTLPGSFQPDMAKEFLTAINSFRASQGLPPLQRDKSLDTRARDWSKQMADRDKLSHSNLSSLLPPWSAAGENVGRGGSVLSLFNALVNSPGHRANMLADFTHIGIGVWKDGNGTLWTTHVFTR